MEINEIIGIFGDMPSMPTGMAIVCKNLALGLSNYPVRVIYFGRFGCEFGFSKQTAIHDDILKYDYVPCEGRVWNPRTVIETVEYYGVTHIFSEDDFFSAAGLVRAALKTKKPLHFLTPLDSLPIHPRAYDIFKRCKKVYVPNRSYKLIKNGVYLPHGVDGNIFYPQNNKDNENNTFTFLWVGRDEPRKALGRTIMALEKIYKKVDCRLIIHSDWRADMAKRTARYLRYKRDLPVVMSQMEGGDQNKLNPIYNSADAFLCTSKAGGFEMGILEAMSCGLPVICIKEKTYMIGNNNVYMVDDMLPQMGILNETGRRQTILQKFIRDYDGELIEIKGRGLIPFEVTPEHPIKIVEKESKTYWNKPNYRHKYSKAHFKQAKFIMGKRKAKVGHIIDCLVFPKFKEIKDVNNIDGIPINIKTVKLFGLWLAEGFTHYKKSIGGKVFWSFGKHENKLATFIQDTLRTEFNKISNCYPTRSGALIVEVSSVKLVKFFDKYFGKGAYNKKIPDFIMLASNSIIQSFIIGYLRGDGDIPKSNYQNPQMARFTTVSPNIALQLQKLFSKLDIFASIFKSDRNLKERKIKGRIIKGNYPCYTISIYSNGMNKLGFKTQLKQNHKYYGEDLDNFYIPILWIKRKHFKGKVYNFETEDHTYQISNVVVHNCTDWTFMQETVDSYEDGFLIPVSSVCEDWVDLGNGKRWGIPLGRKWGNISINALADAMRYMASNRNIVKQMGRKALEKAKKYNWNEIAGKLYKEIVNG